MQNKDGDPLEFSPLEKTNTDSGDNSIELLDSITAVYYNATCLSPNPILEIRNKGDVKPLNKAGVDLLEEARQKKYSILPHDLSQLLRQARRSSKPVKGLGAYGDRGMYWQLVSCPGSDRVFAYGSLEIGQLLDAHNALIEETRLDRLTGSRTWASGLEVLNGMLRHVKDGRGRGIFVLLIDLDNFRETNNKRGHQYGDEVLCCVVRTFKEVLHRENDEIYRRAGKEGGSDEFVICGVVPDFARAHDGAKLIVDAVRERLRQPVDRKGRKMEPIKFSAGATVASWGTSHSAEELEEQADAALIWLKKRSFFRPTRQGYRGGMIFFDELPKGTIAWVSVKEWLRNLLRFLKIAK